ncbi:MAG TPA: tetratricopeptide repeat protein, partial [Candidatus Deferrimicrobium sp.]|nr:tetratricopeptide repeat protein [Candidatus Deferrimicrobium sp.]
MAGGYLFTQSRCSFQSYKKLLDENLPTALNGKHYSGLTKHETDIFKTLQISQSILNEAPILENIINLLSWSGNAFMGISLMAAILDKKETELLDPLEMGVSLHILHKEQDKERYDIHRLVRRVRQEQIPLSDKSEWVKNVCQRLGDWFEERRQKFTDLPTFEAELDHLKQWLNHVLPISNYHSARLTWLQAYPPYHWGKYKESQLLVQSAFTLLSENSEEDPKLKANIINDMGATYSQFGEFQKALEYHMQALEIRQQTFGEHHSDMAMSYNNIGSAHGYLGDDKKALEYKLRALEICQQLFGEQHPDTAISLSNVGKSYGELGDHKKALEYKLRALEIHEKIFGERHPDTATSLNNVGYTYREMGNYNEAIKYLARAFDIYCQLLGELHQNTAVALFNLIYSLIKLKRFPEAGERLDDYLERLPQDHPNFKYLSGLKKDIQTEKRKGLHGMPGKKKNKKR